MPRCWRLVIMCVTCCLLFGAGAVSATPPGQYRLLLKPEQITASVPGADFAALVDEQLDLGDPPTGHAKSGWKLTPAQNKQFPIRVVIDLGSEAALATLWLYDANNMGDVVIHVGQPESWRAVATYGCQRYQSWESITLNTVTRYVMLEIKSSGAPEACSLYRVSHALPDASFASGE